MNGLLHERSILTLANIQQRVCILCTLGVRSLVLAAALLAPCVPDVSTGRGGSRRTVARKEVQQKACSRTCLLPFQCSSGIWHDASSLRLCPPFIAEVEAPSRHRQQQQQQQRQQPKASTDTHISQLTLSPQQSAVGSCTALVS